MNRQCTGYDSANGMSRRQMLSRFGLGLGAVALAELESPLGAAETGPALPALHLAPKAKRVIYLFQSGAPSQIDLFDHKPLLNELHGTELPEEVRRGQRLTSMSGNQASLPLVGSPYKFAQHGESGTWFSELLPHTAAVADQLCMISSMYTEAINHGPAVTFFQTGSQFPGRPSMGAWLNYGLGASNANLPSFVVLISKNEGGQPLISRLWGSGFLPSEHQGVRFRSGEDPVLYLSNPSGIDANSRRAMLHRLRELHELQLERTGDTEIEARIGQYELAYKMQMSIPDVTNMASEPEHIFKLYGEDSREPGTYAANCLLARRLAEQDVRFIQLYHRGWDHHANVPGRLPGKCQQTDQASAALITDLHQRGLLEETLVVWGGEFGRTNYCQGKLAASKFGRDHHPRCFSIWAAGGGIKPGITYGKTDPFSYNVTQDGVHIHDFQATLLHLLGIDHEQLIYKHQGRRYRLTDVHGNVVPEIVA
jgi:hypothetical protein